MTSYDVLIAVTSWEDRFAQGIKHFLDKNSFQQIVLFDYEDYIDITCNNTNDLKAYLANKNTEVKIVPLKHKDSVNNWKRVKSIINDIKGSVVIDISTMPRDIIYASLFHADNSSNISNLYCVYNSPEKYTQETWLTKDPCKPELIFNMSGIFEMDKDTILIIVTGFDKKRVEQLLNYYEPRKIYFCIQTGRQYENNKKNAEKYTDTFKPFLPIETLPIDAYSEDYGFNAIEKIIIDANKQSNILIASLGPKPSSLAIYRLNKKYPNTGLVYVPVTAYNKKYSSGISQNDPIFEKMK
jgi:hypothetical protein